MTGLLRWRDFHPQEWQLDSLHGTLSPDDSRAEHDRSTRVFQTSDFDLFRDLKGVVDLNAEISHCAFNFLVPKK